MERTELQQLLIDGIKAVRQGDRERGRQLLLRVVAEDEGMEPAWLWLSDAVDDPSDKLIALENVLALNPHHAQAQAGLRKLRQQLGLEEPAAPVAAPMPESASEPVGRGQAPPLQTTQTPNAGYQSAAEAEEGPQEPEPGSPTSLQFLSQSYFAAQAEEDPFQCAYCGRPADPDETRCPHCWRSLLVQGPWRGGSFLYLALIIGGLQLQAALVQTVLVYVHKAFPQSAALLPGQETWAANLLVPAVVRTVLWAAVVLVLLNEADWGYALSLGTAALDLAWIGLGYRAGVLGKLLAGVNGALAGAVLLVALAAVWSRWQAHVRLRVVLDRNLQGPVMVQRRAQAYAREGKWALAALHWQRAVGLQPRNPGLYKDLGKAQMRLRRFEQARRAFESGAEMAPADQEFALLIKTLPAQATGTPSPYGPEPQ